MPMKRLMFAALLFALPAFAQHLGVGFLNSPAFVLQPGPPPPGPDLRPRRLAVTDLDDGAPQSQPHFRRVLQLLL